MVIFFLKEISSNANNDQTNIGSGNGLVPSDNKTLPKPVLTHIYVTLSINVVSCHKSLQWQLSKKQNGKQYHKQKLKKQYQL